MSDNIEDVYELSPMQEGILFDYLYNNDITLYHEQNYYRFRGKLDAGLMKKAMDMLALRHTALRTSISYQRLNVPYQVVLKDRRAGFSVVDLTPVSDEKQREADLNELKEKERQQRFDLTTDALIKVMMVQMKADEFVLVWTFHHLIMDAWCIDVLVSEFYAIMSAIALDKRISLAPAQPYSKFIKYIFAAGKADNLAYWNNYLQNYNESKSFLPKQHQLRHLNDEQKSCFVYLGQHNTKTIKDYCDQQGVAISTWFRTVWGILLCKYKGNRDAVFGTIVPGRPPELEGSQSIIGLFMNNIPLRVNYDDDTIFSNLLSRIQNELLNSERHQYVSLSEIKQGRKKLYDNIFMFQNFPVQEKAPATAGDETALFENLELLQSGFHETVAEDVIVRVTSGNDISLEILYNPALYDEKLIRYLLLNFKFLLTFSCRQPHCPLSTFFLLTEEELQSVNFEGPFDHYLALGKQRHYWISRFSGELPIMELPADYDRTHNKTFTKASLSMVLDASVSFAVLMTGAKILLHRYTGQQDIIIGTVVNSQDGVNTIAIRSTVNGEENSKQLLNRIDKNISEAYAHQAYPFHRLVNELAHKLFNVMVLPPGQKNIHDTELTFGFNGNEAKLIVSIEYNTDLFKSDRIERMLHHYVRILESIIKNDPSPVSKINILTEQEEQQLLCEFNPCRNEPFPPVTLVQLFEEQVNKTPDAVALVFEGRELTYGQLNGQANQLAHYLRACGVGEECLVAICMDRSLELVVAILGIVKSGGVYVPIDGDYPEERIKYMLTDSHCRWVLINGSNEKLDRINHHLGQIVDIIDIQDEKELLGLQPVNNVPNDLRPEHAAYVIYTSGSTGKPKGVIIEHGSVVNRLLWGQEYFQLSAADAILQKTHYCFDVSVWEFFWPLIVGARLVIAVPDGHKDSFYMRSVIDREQITVIHFVPSMLESFLEDIQPGDCQSLRRVLCVGEPLTNRHRSLFDDRLPLAELYNLYGPTEAAIEVTCAHIVHGSTGIISIGRPVKNTQMHVLDSYKNLAAVGNIGELYIGGLQVGRGYVNRVELTAGKFVPDPFSKEPGCRLYRTGDIGRWSPNGNLEFLGRIDDQVKIRGYRIELGEIEATLQQLKGVKQAVVVVAEDRKGDKQLVAYIVPDGVFDKEKILAQLRQQLPEYMIPPILTATETIPHTANGKIDRKSLPPIDMNDIVKNDYMAPRNKMEDTLCSIWQDVLGVKQIGIKDNFFEQGGHSLKVMRVIFRIHKIVGIMIDVRELFTFPTIAELSEHIKKQTESLIPAGQQ